MKRATPGHQRRPGPAALALAFFVPVLLGTAAAADLLVTRDGSEIETKGAWRVQGGLVIFHLPDGQLASLQLDGVDLEASRAATERREAAIERPPEPAPPEKKAVLVLTDADVNKAPRADGVAEEAAAGEAGGAEPAAGSERLVVSSWQETSGPEGLVVTGELSNESPDVAASIQLGVLLYDREGGLLDTVLASLTASVLQPGQRARFRADLPGVFDYSSLRFEAESLGLAVGSGEESPGEEIPGDEGSPSGEPRAEGGGAAGEPDSR